MQDLKILIVDDDSLYRETLAAYAQKIGTNVLEASSGNEAFKIIGAQPIDGIITDLRMPDGTGIELLKKIRTRSNELPRIPKIVVNTGIIEGGERYLKALGAARVYVKPVNLKELINSLMECIKDSE